MPRHPGRAVARKQQILRSAQDDTSENFRQPASPTHAGSSPIINAMDWKSELTQAVEQEDEAALRRAALAGTARTIRFLSSRLSASDDGTKWKAVRGLGVVVGERNAVSDERARELLRRFFWSLKEE